ncbi:uncharacterized protein [Dasypus novemcinctus]|uniref:uncharacterized protein n=1 Tax=Dasypus novemcinctus TaxID=9361 RepID=UPI0039C8F6E1
MGIKLTEKELELIKDLPTYEKVDLKNLMDKVKAVPGGEVDVSDVETVLENMGIELTDKELSELMNNLPVDRGKIDASKMDKVLGNMGMNLTEKELEDLVQNLPVDVNGKVELKKVMNEVKPFTGEKVDSSKLESVLGNMGIELMQNECLNLQKTLPINADGKVHQRRLMKSIMSLKQGKVDVNKLDTLLENMGIEITEKEFMDLTKRLPYDANRKVQLNRLMEELDTVLVKSLFQGPFARRTHRTQHIVTLTVRFRPLERQELEAEAVIVVWWWCRETRAATPRRPASALI